MWKSTYQVGRSGGGWPGSADLGPSPDGAPPPSSPFPSRLFLPRRVAGGPSAQARRGRLRSEEMRGCAELDPQHVAAQRQPVSWPGFPGPLVLASQEAKNGPIPDGRSAAGAQGGLEAGWVGGPRLLGHSTSPSPNPGSGGYRCYGLCGALVGPMVMPCLWQGWCACAASK